MNVNTRLTVPCVVNVLEYKQNFEDNINTSYNPVGEMARDG